MDLQSFTLRDFFRDETIGEEAVSGLHSEEDVRELDHNANDRDRHSRKSSALIKAVIGHVDDLLGIEVRDILLRAWDTYEDLAQYADPQRLSPDELVVLPLMEHAITSIHRPTIEVEFTRRLKKTVPFTITIDLDLSGFMLEIRDGKIMKILTGQCFGRGEVCCMNTLLYRKESGRINLPGAIDMGKGIAITPRADSSPRCV